ncbi:MAG: hypothetical protein RLZZ440_2447, partial [Planctomycetota bacterium]
MLDEDRLTRLLDRHVDDMLTAAELAELDEMLQASPQARILFWEHARWNAAVRDWGERSWGTRSAVAPDPAAASWWRSRARLGRRQLMAFGSTAAALAGAWAGSAALRRWIGPAARQSFPADAAIVTAVRDGRWQGDGPGLGQAVGPGRLVLQHGEVGLGFASGAELVVRGPADFSIRSALRLEMASGILAAHVPPEAEGFVVKTPAVEVIDLGTAFGVAAEAETVDVSVFSGQVEARAAGMPEADIRNLPAGQSRRFVDGVSQGPSPRGDRASFPRLPSDASDRPRTNGGVRLLESPPATLTGLESNDFILLFREMFGVTLPRNLMLDIHSPGVYATEESVRPRQLSDALVADSYLLHFKARHELVGKGSEWVVLDGSVTFPRPILGIVCRTPTLRASDRVIAAAAAGQDAGDDAG